MNIIQGRNRNGCNVCASSFGERKIFDFLTEHNIKFIGQKKFDDLIGVGKGLLSYDFYIQDCNLLIEYQGEQHERPVKFNGITENEAKKCFIRQKEHDKRKREYAKEHNIKLLEIWYWDYDNIEEILNENIK